MNKLLTFLNDLLTTYWPHMQAPLLAFAITVARGLYSGGKLMKTLMEGVLLGLFTVALRPLLLYLELPDSLAIFLGAFGAFLGVEWMRANLDNLAQSWFSRRK